MPTSPVSRLVRAWLLTAISDGLFSSILVTVFYGSTFARLWQGVASVPLGPDALNGGTRTVIIGLLMHFSVALIWSLVFLLLLLPLPPVRRALSTRFGYLKVAAFYGPIIWMMMSIVIIPIFTKRPPTYNYRWWIQFFGHIPFVALPIVSQIGSGVRQKSP